MLCVLLDQFILLCVDFLLELGDLMGHSLVAVCVFVFLLLDFGQLLGDEVAVGSHSFVEGLLLL